MNNRTNITKLLGFNLALLSGMAYAGHTNRDVTSLMLGKAVMNIIKPFG
ncbi:hypothetical protein [Vibrio caribbeanicus]|nr:hypothetical protein [Vibrio caribbeanicus]MCY9845780.1 hypothetical protein [Vibrio caribbeanicus]